MDGEGDALAEARIQRPCRTVRLFFGGKKAGQAQEIGGGHPLQAVTQRIERFGSVADAEFRDRFRCQAAPGEIFARPGALRRTQLLFKPGCCHLMQLEQFAALAILLGLFRGGKFPLRQRNARLLSHDFNGFGKADVLHLLHEGENVARLVAAEAIVELTHRVHGEGRGFLAVERTQSGEFCPPDFFSVMYSPMMRTMSACCFTSWAKSDATGLFLTYSLLFGRQGKSVRYVQGRQQLLWLLALFSQRAQAQRIMPFGQPLPLVVAQ